MLGLRPLAWGKIRIRSQTAWPSSQRVRTAGKRNSRYGIVRSADSPVLCAWRRVGIQRCKGRYLCGGGARVPGEDGGVHGHISKPRGHGWGIPSSVVSSDRRIPCWKVLSSTPLLFGTSGFLALSASPFSVDPWPWTVSLCSASRGKRLIESIATLIRPQATKLPRASAVLSRSPPASAGPVHFPLTSLCSVVSCAGGCCSPLWCSYLLSSHWPR